MLILLILIILLSIMTIVIMMITSTGWLQRMGGKITYGGFDVFDDPDNDIDNDDFNKYKDNNI